MQRWFNSGKPISTVHHICRLKEKNHKTVLIDAYRIQLCLHLSFMIKNKQLSKLEIEGNFPSIILSYEILSAFPKTSSNAEVSAPNTCNILGILANTIGKKKEGGKGTIFIHSYIFGHVEKPKDSLD